MITEDTLSSLQTNDPRQDNLFFYLDDYSYDQDGDDDLTQALRGNTSVTAVDVDMHLEEMTEALGTLMTATGHLQNLQRLRCSSSGDYAVTMAALARTVAVTKTTKCLTSLDLANFLLYTSQQQQENSSLAVHSYQEFVDALQNHPTLKNFNLGFGYSSDNDNADATDTEATNSEAFLSLTQLVQALRSIPTLDWVRLDGASFAPRTALTSNSLASLCSCNSNTTTTTAPTTNNLTVLEVHDFDFSLQHVRDLASALESNSSLKVLSLSCHEYYSMDDAPEQSASKSISGSTKTVPAEAMCIAQALRRNTCLEKLLLPMILLTGTFPRAVNNHETKRQDNMTVQALLQIYSALQVNHTLQELQVLPTPQKTGNSISVNITPAAIAAFRNMLQHNYGLQRLELPYFTSDDWKAEIQLHMKLNLMGRGRLVRDTRLTRHQWMEALEQVRDDVSCLFHMLLLNPLLCNISGDHTS